MEFSTDIVIRGHHIYKEIWAPVIGKCVQCEIKILEINFWMAFNFSEISENISFRKCPHPYSNSRGNIFKVEQCS